MHSASLLLYLQARYNLVDSLQFNSFKNGNLAPFGTHCLETEPNFYCPECERMYSSHQQIRSFNITQSCGCFDLSRLTIPIYLHCYCNRPR